MNSKSLTLNNLGIIEELNFIRSYHKYLLEYCIENEISYDGKIAVAILKLNEDIDLYTFTYKENFNKIR